MGFFRVRFTVRWMMVAVAVVALILGAETIRRRWAYFRHRALFHEEAEKVDRFLLGGSVWAYLQQEDGWVERMIFAQAEQEIDEAWSMEATPTRFIDGESLRRRADYHARLKKKYRRAAARPWLRVGPDPPLPP